MEENINEQTDPLQRAEEIAKRIEDGNKEAARLNAELKELMIKQRLGGNSNAGQTEEKKKEIDPVEYAKAALNGKILS